MSGVSLAQPATSNHPRAINQWQREQRGSSLAFLWILVACVILIAVLVLFRFALQRDEAAEIVPKIDSMRRASPC